MLPSQLADAFAPEWSSGGPHPEDVGAQATSRGPWTAYYGAVQDTPAWTTAQRGGNFTDENARIRIGMVHDLLQRRHLLSWAPPYPSPTSLAGVTEFMNRVRSTDGLWWRERSLHFASDLITAHRTTPRKVIGIQLGNEITGSGYGDRIRSWARNAGLPYPHPRSHFNDGDAWFSRDYIGYYVEYFFAPAAQAIRAANGNAAKADRIPIVLGSVVGARHPFVTDHFLPALLNYRIGGGFAPALAGRVVKDLVKVVSVHYLLTPEKIFGYSDRNGKPLPYGYRRALTDLHDRWVGNGAVRSVWHTEEGGKLAQVEDRHASLAIRVFGRTMSWAIDKGVPPSQFRIFGMYKPPAGGWGGYNPRPATSWSFAMSKIEAFIGHKTRLINRSGSLSVHVSDPVEKYAFETTSRKRRILIVTPQTSSWQGATRIRHLTIKADGWTAAGSRIAAKAHLFKSDAEGYRAFDVRVTRSADGSRYTVHLPTTISLDGHNEQRSLMVNLRHP